MNSCKGAAFHASFVVLKFPGDYGGGVTPVPIPNTVVKPSCADGTAGVTLWESRSLPGVINKKGPDETLGLSY